MLRGILTRVFGGRRTTATGSYAQRPARTGTTAGSTGDVERGARTLFRGLSRRRRGL
jgi:hypothetical protein